MQIKPLLTSDYGPLASKVVLEPDFFTGFEPQRRKEIVAEEAKFYHSITEPYSVDDRLEKYYTDFASFDGERIPIKVYSPKKPGSGRAALIFIHGGGFKTCSIETHDFVPSYVAANADLVAFSVEYRLAPEHKFPVGLKDCFEAVKWVQGNAERFGIDPLRVSVGGDSSGGSFSASLCLMARSENVKIASQVLIYPATDIGNLVEKKSAQVYTMVGATDDDDGPKETLLDTYLADPAQVNDELVSPLVAKDLSGLPKALFIQAECDALCDDGLMYATRLKEAGVPVEAHLYKGMPHAFILRTYEETFEALDTICAFLK